MARRRHPRLRAAALLLVVIPLAGALVAATLAPFVVGTGLAARSSADLLVPLPVELTDRTFPGPTVVLAADGSVITYFYERNRQPVPAERIADVVEQALVAIEDRRFYTHDGVDYTGIARALWQDIKRQEAVQGGSTIMQ